MFYDGPFSGSSATDMNSVIDLIRAAAAANHSAVYFVLGPGTEKVKLTAGSDLGETGLVLNSGNSPASVVIDGGNWRTIELETTDGDLITVGAGITLTLRNITITGHSDDSDNYPVEVEADGTLIRETGVEISVLPALAMGEGSDMATGGTVTHIPVDGDPSKIWEIHTFTQSGGLEFINDLVPATAEVLVVGGGGGGGGTMGATSSGGGAGRYIYHPAFKPAGEYWGSPGVINVVVGAGGNGGGQGANGGNGGNSEFFMSNWYRIIAPGGGGGAGNYGVASVGNNGGSGGGSHDGQAGRTSAVTGTVPAGDGTLNLGSAGGAYNGGGAGGIPTGRASDISGVSTTYAAGGGLGGFGNAVNGTGNGGNGGSGTVHVGGAGGSGIVIVRFRRAAP